MARRNVAGICEIAECEDRTVGRGWCRKHYARWRRTGDPEQTRTGLKGTIEHRFWEQVGMTEDASQCWEWQSGLGAHGYGTTSLFLGRSMGAHRAAFFLDKGYWPKLFVLHSCDNPPCVNPSHLREGTAQDNADDARSRNRGVGKRKPSEAVN